MAFYEKKLSRQDIYDGYIIHVHKDEVELPDGNTSFREIVDHHGGVCIVAVDSDGGVFTVRQFRYAYGREITEIPAGKLEAGEDPLDCAARELSEETGCTAERAAPPKRSKASALSIPPRATRARSYTYTLPPG